MSNPLRRWADSFFHVYQKTDLTSWEHAPQDTRPIYGVYHVYCAHGWQRLVSAQLETLRESGLLAATRKLFVSIIAPSEGHLWLLSVAAQGVYHVLRQLLVGYFRLRPPPAVFRSSGYLA